jgi:hypothetical protein
MPTRCNRYIFIPELSVCSTCFGHNYAHHQGLEIITQVVAACCIWFSSCRYSVELRIVCLVCGLQPANQLDNKWFIYDGDYKIFIYNTARTTKKVTALWRKKLQKLKKSYSSIKSNLFVLLCHYKVFAIYQNASVLTVFKCRTVCN